MLFGNYCATLCDSLSWSQAAGQCALGRHPKAAAGTSVVCFCSTHLP